MMTEQVIQTGSNEHFEYMERREVAFTIILRGPGGELETATVFDRASLMQLMCEWSEILTAGDSIQVIEA